MVMERLAFLEATTSIFVKSPPCVIAPEQLHVIKTPPGATSCMAAAFSLVYSFPVMLERPNSVLSAARLAFQNAHNRQVSSAR